MNDQEIEDLLGRYVNGSATEQEAVTIDKWYASLAGQETLPELDKDVDVIKSSIWNKIQKRSWSNFYRYAAAAILIIGIGIGSYTYLHKNSDQQNASVLKQEIRPGGNRAILILANGKKINLNNTSKGLVAQQNQTLISKTADGKIIYQRSEDNRISQNLYNTMSTPRGGSYQLTLSDGTSVTLDAASSIRYPVQFAGVEREIEVTGQAYFEVAHDAAHPFHVISKGQNIEVLGTHFNVNAYEDETVTKTTLSEGSVKILTDDKHSVKLKPGEQSILKQGKLKVDKVDLEVVMAWKNGQFLFSDETLGEIMRKVSRWYDVDIIYTGGVDQEQLFGGGVSRYDNVSKVLRKLEKTGGIHFKIEGRRIIIGK